MNITVSTSFPSQGHLGDCWNYELAPNSLQSNEGCSLPGGISKFASFSFESPYTSYIGVNSNHKIVFDFNFPQSGIAGDLPACGPYDIHGKVTNPFGGTKSGTYSVNVILYLPLIASSYAMNLSANTSTIYSTAAIGSIKSFHSNPTVFEELYTKIFNETIGYQAVFQLGSTRSIYPHQIEIGSGPFAEFVAGGSVGESNTYTLQWLANYGATHLIGFTDISGNTYSEVNIYPSYSSDMKDRLSKIGDPVYAKLVLFSDVNTTLTPAYNYYSQDKYMYQLLWGELWK